MPTNLLPQTIDLSNWVPLAGQYVGDNQAGGGSPPVGGGGSSSLQTGYYLSVGGEDPATPVSPPARGLPGFTDTNYGVQLIRATDQPVDYTTGGYSSFLRQEYARKQIFNTDDSRFLALSIDGFYHVFNLVAGEPVYVERLDTAPFPGGDCEINWHPTNPDVIRYTATNGGLVFSEYDISTGQVSTFFDLTNVSAVRRTSGGVSQGTSITSVMPTAARAWKKAEGSPSIDQDIWGFMIEEPDFTFLGFAIYRVSTNEIISYMLAGEAVDGASGAAIFRPDHCSVDPTGQFFIPSWAFATSLGTRAMDVNDLTNQTPLHFASEHSDVGLMPSGNPVYISLAFQAEDGSILPTSIGNRGGLFAQEIEMVGGVVTKTLIDLTHLSTYTAGTQGVAPALHISAQNFDKPGYFVLSTYSDALTSPPGFVDHKICICEIADNGNIYHLGRTHNTGASYWRETQATTNRSLTRIAFCSDWNANSEDAVEQYHYLLSAGDIPPLDGIFGGAGPTGAQSALSYLPDSYLFVGNSYTGTFDMPAMFTAMMSEAGYTPVINSAIQGGAEFSEHFANPVTFDLVSSGNYEAVILQGGEFEAQFDISGSPTSFTESGQALADLVINDGNNPVFFTVWEHITPDDNIATIAASYEALADSRSAPTVPVGQAFDYAINTAALGINLYLDNAHANEAGTFLAACCHFAFFTQSSPENLAYEAGLSTADADALKAAAWAVVNPYNLGG